MMALSPNTFRCAEVHREVLLCFFQAFDFTESCEKAWDNHIQPWQYFKPSARHEPQTASVISRRTAAEESSLNFYIHTKKKNKKVQTISAGVPLWRLGHVRWELRHIAIWDRCEAFRLCSADLPLSSHSHLPITRFSPETLMTLIMWRRHLPRQWLCVRARPYAFRGGGGLKADCTGGKAELPVTSLRISPPWSHWQKKYGCRAARATHNGLSASVLECHPRCPLPFHKSRNNHAGRPQPCHDGQFTAGILGPGLQSPPKYAFGR